MASFGGTVAADVATTVIVVAAAFCGVGQLLREFHRRALAFKGSDGHFSLT